MKEKYGIELKVCTGFVMPPLDEEVKPKFKAILDSMDGFCVTALY